MSFPRCLAVLLIALAILPSAALAQGQVSWAIADRPDDKIETLVARLEPYLEPLPGREDAAGAVLYHQILIAPDEGEHRRCENLILTIQDPDGMPEELMQPRQTGDDPVTSMSAFVRRGGEYRRLAETDLVHVAGREDLGRGRFEIAWGELEKGDVIGWSMVTSRDQPYGIVGMPLAQRIPIVLAALQVQAKGKFAYELRSNGISRKDVSQKKDEVVDGRAMVVKASANQRPAVDEVPGFMPWPSEFPSMTLLLSEVRIDSENQFVLPGWAKTGGWNQGLATFGGIVGEGAENLGGMEITLSTITTGKTTPEAKTEAVFGWVRDQITLLEGPEIRPHGRREFEEIVKSKEATAWEKPLLMAVLLEKLELEYTIATLRRPDLGPLDKAWPNSSQFSDVAVRTVENGVIRYWVPQCTDCPPGEPPASWLGADVVTYDYATIAVAEKYQETLREKAMVEGRFDLSAIQADIERQPWSIFERIGQ